MTEPLIFDLVISRPLLRPLPKPDVPQLNSRQGYCGMTSTCPKSANLM